MKTRKDSISRIAENNGCSIMRCLIESISPSFNLGKDSTDMFHLILRTYITNPSALFVVVSGTLSLSSTIDLFGALLDKIAHLPRRRMICARSSKLTPLSSRSYLETVSLGGR